MQGSNFKAVGGHRLFANSQRLAQCSLLSSQRTLFLTLLLFVTGALQSGTVKLIEEAASLAGMTLPSESLSSGTYRPPDMIGQLNLLFAASQYGSSSPFSVAGLSTSASPPSVQRDTSQHQSYQPQKPTNAMTTDPQVCGSSENNNNSNVASAGAAAATAVASSADFSSFASPASGFMDSRPPSEVLAPSDMLHQQENSGSLDDASRSVQAIAQDIDDLQLNVEALAHDLGISPSQLPADLLGVHVDEFSDTYSSMITAASARDRNKLLELAENPYNQSIYDNAMKSEDGSSSALSVSLSLIIYLPILLTYGRNSSISLLN